ncbi:MAG: hypothetical protein H0V80_06980 [Acidobacteria bacterium]|nr:hypothetical protein [Acidobacteriota bacterium]
MAAPVDVMRALIGADPGGAAWLPRLLQALPEIHWGAVRTPGILRATPLAREINIVDGVVRLPCCLETSTLVLALEDARDDRLPAGMPADPQRHRVSQVIEALRVIASGRHFGVAIIAREGYAEPHRTTILEGLPHLEREEAEDLYANYWGWISEETLDALASS